jgi:hypothetical protein
MFLISEDAQPDVSLFREIHLYNNFRPIALRRRFSPVLPFGLSGYPGLPLMIQMILGRL